MARIFIRATASSLIGATPFPSPHLMWTKFGGHPRWEGVGLNTRAQHHETKRRNNQREPHITDLSTKERRGPKTPPPSSRNQPVKDFADPRDHHNLQQKNCRNSQCPCYASRVVEKLWPGSSSGPFLLSLIGTPPSPSPHAMWAKFGGHPKKVGVEHASVSK